MNGNPTDALSRRLEGASRRLAALDGERAALSARKETVAREAGLAKGRLARKPEVDRFLEELQAEAHARQVGNFERLLSALVDEVLPGEGPIGLDLELERGVPSLDVVARRAGGASEDIFDDQGGAVTNVVSMGLRMISVVRSGMRRFLVLDEADCWIKNDRVPSFYTVLTQAASKVGVQCLAISHHDLASFAGQLSVAELSGRPEMAGGVRIANPARPYRWRDDEEGIRWIRLRNFQGFADATLQLTPGVNAIVGENNRGKSSFVRAFRAVFYGEARDSLIRRGEKECAVEIGFSGGRVLHWNRRPRRNPVNVWKLLGPDGTVMADEGMIYETGGRTVPDWVPELFGIGPVEGMDVHAAKQKSPVFLLDKPGSMRAAVLSVGHESGYIRKMAAAHKERCARDSACVRDGEAEMSKILDRLARLETAEPLSDSLAKARDLLGVIAARTSENARLEEAAARLCAAHVAGETARRRLAALSRLPLEGDVRKMEAQAASLAQRLAAADALERASERLKRTRAVSQALAGLPQTPTLKDVDGLRDAVEGMTRAKARRARAQAAMAVLAALPEVPSVRKSEDLIRAGKHVKDARLARERALARRNAFTLLPASMPDLSGASGHEAALAAIENARAARAAAAAAASRAAEGMGEIERELAEIANETGGACPMCGGAVGDPAMLLGGHGHEGHAHG